MLNYILSSVRVCHKKKKQEEKTTICFLTHGVFLAREGREGRSGVLYFQLWPFIFPPHFPCSCRAHTAVAEDQSQPSSCGEKVHDAGRVRETALLLAMESEIRVPRLTT